MRIKKYIGQTAHEAMLKLKNELGPDAVVLNTKTIKAKGLFGHFKKPLVEITAGVEEKSILNNNSPHNYEAKLNNINRELAELKSLMKNLTYISGEVQDVSLSLKKYHDNMINNGIDPEISLALLKEIEKQINVSNKDTNTIQNIIKFSLSEKLGNPQPIIVEGNQKIVFFVGPTGVGKTTTLAKIAAKFVVDNKYSVGLITSDTYRIAAVEQLKIYSDILQIPLEIAYNEAEMVKAINHFNDKNIILIDTAGRNHNDLDQIEELKNMINTTNQKEVFLLINATIDSKVLKSLIEKYSFLNEYKLIITKIDEAENYGNILNIKYITNKELSYYTTGQNVPDDIEIVNVEDIAEKLIKENTNE